MYCAQGAKTPLSKLGLISVGAAQLDEVVDDGEGEEELADVEDVNIVVGGGVATEGDVEERIIEVEMVRTLLLELVVLGWADDVVWELETSLLVELG